MEGIVKIEDLRVHSIIGCREHEREFPQELSVNISYRLDMTECVQSDLISDTIDYQAIYAAAQEIADEQEFHLIETYAFELSHYLLAEFPFLWVKVEVKKPMALPCAAYASITFEISAEES